MKLKLSLAALAFTSILAAALCGQNPSPTPGPDASPKPRRLRVSQGVATGNLIHKVEPQYPLEAKEKGIEGVVLLKVLINREGAIGSCEQVEGDSILGKAATEAVTQWKYRPYLLNGEPVEVETMVKISFNL